MMSLTKYNTDIMYRDDIKRHGRVSALKCMRETDCVSIREPASCENLRLSDLNNDSAD